MIELAAEAGALTIAIIYSRLEETREGTDDLP